MEWIIHYGGRASAIRGTRTAPRITSRAPGLSAIIVAGALPKCGSETCVGRAGGAAGCRPNVAPLEELGTYKPLAHQASARRKMNRKHRMAR